MTTHGRLMGTRDTKLKTNPGRTILPSVSGEPPRVLLGVKDEGMRQVLASPLRMEGFDVVEAAEVTELLGALALSLVQGRWYEPVDAIVVDAREDFEIITAIAKLRAAEWTTPVVVIAAQGDFETAERAKKLGAASVFHMPFQAVDLRATVRKMIAQR